MKNSISETKSRSDKTFSANTIQAVMSNEDVLRTARKVLDYEIEALKEISLRLGESLLNTVKLLAECKGKIIVTGLGKSGLAAKKIAATLASTGAPALFLHAAEGIHGDMGVVTAGDVAIAVSYSGETSEVSDLIPRFKLLGVPVVAVTGVLNSTLAKFGDTVLDVSVPPHPWPFGLLPTASYVSTVAVGDALAVALIAMKGIREEDFAVLHPGGLLGRKMLVAVSDVMQTGAALPLVKADTGMRAVLVEMTEKRLGVTCVVDDDKHLLGIITDGDIRRLLEISENPLDPTAEEVMTKDPRWISPKRLCAKALHIMEKHKITSLPVLDDNRTIVGIVHMHDILTLETNR